MGDYLTYFQLLGRPGADAGSVRGSGAETTQKGSKGGETDGKTG